jgi:hypothetical protein
MARGGTKPLALIYRFALGGERETMNQEQRQR